MSTMDTLGVRLPEKQKKELEEKIEREGYPNVSEYVRELIRDDLREERIKEEAAREIKRRKEELESDEVKVEDMRTMEEIAEDEGIKSETLFSSRSR
jgi:Arc/MetJ-type ribon-helix-helix transcriptional regulator